MSEIQTTSGPLQSCDRDPPPYSTDYCCCISHYMRLDLRSGARMPLEQVPTRDMTRVNPGKGSNLLAPVVEMQINETQIRKQGKAEDTKKRNRVPRWDQHERFCLNCQSASIPAAPGNPAIHSLPTILGMQLLEHINPRSAKKKLLICLVPGCKGCSLWAWKGSEWVEKQVGQASDSSLDQPG